MVVYKKLDTVTWLNLLKKNNQMFKTFNKNPWFFLSDSDIQCYLYSLFIIDPLIGNFYLNIKNLINTKQTVKSLILIQI